MSSLSDLHRTERDELQLLGYCKKILRGIEEPTPNSEQRAIWELVQNARDISNDCHIEIRLYPDRLEFAHQGAPFENRTLFSLVIQSSSKDAEDAEQVGQYGTGFMTTHTFNTKVRIDGTYEVKDAEGNHVAYYPMDNFVLDRSGVTARDIFEVMRNTTIPAIDELENQPPIFSPRQWTVFTYELEKKIAEKLSKQLDEVMRLIPLVLVVNKSIKELRLQNNISHTSYQYSKAPDEDSAGKGSANGWKKVTQAIRVNSESGENRILSIHTLQSEDAKDVIFIPPFEPFFGDANALPSLFLWFPLLGSEKFGVNFIFHSEHFYPVEQRNNIQLPLTNTKHPFKYQTNERVLNEMFDALFAYYQNEENAIRLPIEHCRVHFPCLRDEDDVETKRFFDELQRKWVKAIQEWKIIPTEDSGYLPMNDKRLRVLAPEFYENLSADARKQYEPIMRHFAEMVSAGEKEKILLPKDNLIRWSQIVAEWNIDAEYSIVTLKQVCECIKTRSEELHQFLEWLKALGQEGLFEEYALIPNREGQLCRKKDLRDGETIPEVLYRIARPIATDKLDVLVDPAFADICDIMKFTRGDMRDVINASVRDLRNETIERTIYNNFLHRYESAPRLLTEAGCGVTIQQIIYYCSAFPNETNSSLRWRMIPCICAIFDCGFAPITIKNEIVDGDEKPTELYDVCFNYLIEYTMYYLSKQRTDWLIENGQKTGHYQQLLLFVSEYAESAKSNMANMDRLKKYTIFPNQRYELCQLESLKRNNVVEPDFAQLYDEVMGNAIETEWVEDDFSELVVFEEQKAMVLGKKMEDEKLRPYLEKKRNNKTDFVYNESLEKTILQIINHLEKEEWTEYFDYLAQKDNLRNISYELGTAAQKDALYRIKMEVDCQATLDRLANIAGNPKVKEILDQAEVAVKQFEEQKRQFTVTYEIGKQVEIEIRSRISQELDVAYCKTIKEYMAADEQNGQDIVIRRGTEKLFYIECKAKWNFSDPAHMSSQQMKQAVRHKNEYALFCVDCTPDTGCKVPFNATKEDVHEKINDILAHTHVHLEIGEQLAAIIETEVSYEDMAVDEDSTIKLYSSLSCNIPKKVFVNGISFEEFMQYIHDCMKKNQND